MPVMRSVFYVPGNNESFIAEGADDAGRHHHPRPGGLSASRREAQGQGIVRENLKFAGSGGSTVYVRINNWETLMTNDDLEAIVYQGLSGVCLAKVRRSGRRAAPRLEARGAGAQAGSARRKHRHPAPHRNGQRASSMPILPPLASKRVNSLIFGAVDYTKDMRVKLTSEGVEQFYARRTRRLPPGQPAASPSTAPSWHSKDVEAFEKSTREGRQMGYEGRMLIHPNQIEPSNRIYSPSPEDVEWAKGVVKVFEEEGIAKGMAAVSYKGKMVDTPVYDNARTILATMDEIEAFDKKRKKG